jgi:uncharacterized membrane protein YbhN (UPF0104 family)
MGGFHDFVLVPNDFVPTILFGNHVNAHKFISEARARIIWGEPSSSVRDFLISNGISDLVADAKLKEFELERNRELRKIGLRNALIGILLTGAAGITLYIALPHGSVTSGFLQALAVVLMAGVYGLLKLGKGVIYLICPQSEHKSIPNIVQSDLIE